MELERRRFTDYFDLLDVDRTATKDELQKAFMLKASIWHPDKAENDKDREYFTKMYQDLQIAYKILSNEQTRKQYLDSQQTTNLEFKFAERDIGYSQTDQFKQHDGKFDVDGFRAAFEQTRDQKEIEAMQRLQQTQYGQSSTVNQSDLENLMLRRNAELNQLDAETAHIFAGEFDSNVFNRAFDYMRQKNPGKGVQPYEGNPMGMFSGGGLQECDPMSGIAFKNGTDFTGRDIDDLVSGQSSNPNLNLDITTFNTGEQYGTESKLSENEIQSKLAAMMADRDQVLFMDKSQYIVEPSEIEQLYSGLFQSTNIEELEAPTRQAPVALAPQAPQIPSQRAGGHSVPIKRKSSKK